MPLTKESIVPYVFGEAAKSNVEKRKVGCVIVDMTFTVVGVGHNYDSVHAEAAALADMRIRDDVGDLYVHATPLTAYVTHQPCPDCAQKLLAAGVTTITVVEEFLKFDANKVRYDLVPPASLKAWAEVLTYGASKYKPGNWAECKDPERYVAAAMRHFEAYRAGETLDAESKMHHLAHAMCNLSFLFELNYAPNSSRIEQ